MAHGGQKIRLGALAGLGEAAGLDQLLVAADQIILPPPHLQRGQQARAQEGGFRPFVDAVQRAEFKRAQPGRRVVRAGERDEQRDAGRRMILEAGAAVPGLTAIPNPPAPDPSDAVCNHCSASSAPRTEASATPSAARTDDSFSAHWGSSAHRKMCEAGWLMAKDSGSFFSFSPSPDIKHALLQSANAIFKKENISLRMGEMDQTARWNSTRPLPVRTGGRPGKGRIEPAPRTAIVNRAPPAIP